jgi:hypothetical protein
MAKRKPRVYKGTVLKEFKVGYLEGTKTYKVGDTFETLNKNSLEHLINIKKLK